MIYEKTSPSKKLANPLDTIAIEKLNREDFAYLRIGGVVGISWPGQIIFYHKNFVVNVFVFLSLFFVNL